MIDTSKHTFIATAAFGLEGLVKRELLRLGFADARAENGGVRFTADFAGAFTACLWLACADRVLLMMAEGEARSFEELFQLVRSAPWESVLPPDAAIPVSGRCARSQLMSVRDCQAITKKAIVDRMLQGHRVRTLPETGARYAVDVALHGDVARLTLDLCGDALNRRGYRTWNGEAPLISGSDISPEALELARRHIRQAGLEGKITVYQRDLRDLQLSGPAPCFLCNPPYGERLGDRKSCEQLYRAMKGLMQRHPGCTLNVITSHPGFERVAGMHAQGRTRLYNGRLECEFLRFTR